MYIVVYENERVLNLRKFGAWPTAFNLLAAAEQKAAEIAAKDKRRAYVVEFIDPPFIEPVKADPKIVPMR